VARSAGGEGAIYPTLKHCRDFLQEVLQLPHRVVMSPPIQEEWNKHKSIFARTWLTSMVARRRVLYVGSASRDDLRPRLADCASNEKSHAAMLKDFHLVEAALATDRTVIALDEVVRRLFCGASSAIGELRTIVWANPDKEVEDVIQWLRDGAEPQSHRLLKAEPPLFG